LEQTELRKLGQNVRMVVCDLDQTLLNSDATLSSENLAAIRAAEAKGIFVTICSGRIFTMLEAYARALDIQGPVITTNGAAIVDGRTGELLSKHSIPREAAVKILDYARERDYDYSALTGQVSFFSGNSLRIKRFERYNEIAEAGGLEGMRLEYFDGRSYADIENDVLKMLLYQIPEDDFASVIAFLDKIPEICYTSSDEGLLDVMAAGTNKGTAVAEVRELLGLEKAQVCVFGDYINDLPMFNEAGLTVAMANAHEELKKQALYVTDTNDQAGVARAIEVLML
jgi:Cof subfamily protein (haloacid dehalogenase superfamily)